MIQTVSIKSLKSDLLNLLNRKSPKIVEILQQSITDILRYNGKKWTDAVDAKTKKNTIDILLLTKNLKPESSFSIDKILSELNDYVLVYDENNNWLELNKLNTNRSDLPIFLTDLVFLFDEIDVNKIINDLVVNNFDSLISCVNKAKENPKFVWDKLLNKPDKYLQNIRKYSKQGEKIENDIKEEYLKNGWEIIHKGGDGNLIDMKLGVDLIVKKNERYLFLQIKKVHSINDIEIDSQKYVEVKGDTYLNNYAFIDALIYCTLDGKKIGVKNQIYYVKKNDKLVSEKGIPCPSRANENSIFLKR